MVIIRFDDLHDEDEDERAKDGENSREEEALHPWVPAVFMLAARSCKRMAW